MDDKPARRPHDHQYLSPSGRLLHGNDRDPPDRCTGTPAPYLQLGIDPVHFGLIVILNLLIGATTPPFGVLLFIVQHIAQVSFARLVRAMLPFYVPLIVALVLITYWPDLSLWLPRFVKG